MAARATQKLRRMLAQVEKTTSGAARILQLVTESDIELESEEWRAEFAFELEQWSALSQSASPVHVQVAAVSDCDAKSDVPDDDAPDDDAPDDDALDDDGSENDASSECDRGHDRLLEARGGVELLPTQGSKCMDGRLAYELESLVIDGDVRGVLSYLDGDMRSITPRGVHPDARCLLAGCSKPRSTALTTACIMGKLEIVELLLGYGATVDLQDFDHDGKPTEGTALHYAAVNNHPAIVSCLLQHGASRDSLNHNGLTALEWAREANSRSWSSARGSFSTVIRLLTLSPASMTHGAIRAALQQLWNGRLLHGRSIRAAPWAIHGRADSQPGGEAESESGGESLLGDDLMVNVLRQLDSQSACEFSRVSLGS